MIASALLFVFGFFTALLLALLVSPLVWRRSRRLARREFEATIPATANEIRASFDHVRAEAAMTSRRREILADETRAKAAEERAISGRIFKENADLREENAELSALVSDLRQDLHSESSALAARDEELDRLSGQLEDAHSEILVREEEFEALAGRFEEAGAVAQERGERIDALNSRLAALSDDKKTAELREREGRDAIERLRAEVEAIRLEADREAQDEQPSQPPSPSPASETATETGEDGASPPVGGDVARRVAAAFGPVDHLLDLDRLDDAGLRERIAEIAARVVRLTAEAEGEASPLHAILREPAASAPPTAAAPGYRTLAARIGSLADDKQREAPPPLNAERDPMARAPAAPS